MPRYLTAAHGAARAATRRRVGGRRRIEESGTSGRRPCVTPAGRGDWHGSVATADSEGFHHLVEARIAGGRLVRLVHDEPFALHIEDPDPVDAVVAVLAAV